MMFLRNRFQEASAQGTGRTPPLRRRRKEQRAMSPGPKPEDAAGIENHRVVPHAEWIAARTELLAREKEFTRQCDEMSRLRRALPWERVEKPYAFEGARGRQTLADLFDGRSQLVVYHFMFHPDDEAGCPHCSLRADGFGGVVEHLRHRDVTFVVVSRAPYAKLAAYRERMGWTFPWFSSGASEFNFDFHVSFTPEEMARRKAFFNYRMQDPLGREREGHSIFFRNRAGEVFHTYSCYDRGNDQLNIHYHYLDLVPKGRDEGDRGPYWVERRGEYGS
jgi:predicted dithiol-disulfide oxidoreductase (DUF899 family)